MKNTHYLSLALLLAAGSVYAQDGACREGTCSETPGAACAQGRAACHEACDSMWAEGVVMPDSEARETEATAAEETRMDVDDEEVSLEGDGRAVDGDEDVVGEEAGAFTTHDEEEFKVFLNDLEKVRDEFDARIGDLVRNHPVAAKYGHLNPDAKVTYSYPLGSAEESQEEEE
jgi:hypothetical protein